MHIRASPDVVSLLIPIGISVIIVSTDIVSKSPLKSFFSFLLPYLIIFWASLVTQLVKNLPAVWETWVRSLGWEDPLEKEKATHSSILTWRIPRTI